MSIREQLDVLEKIEAVAALAGIEGEIDEERMAFAWYSTPGNWYSSPL